MANVYINEYEVLRDGLPYGQPIVSTVAATDTVSSTHALNADTAFVRFHTDGIMSYIFGVNTVALTSHQRVAADQTVEHAVPDGVGYNLYIITNS